MNDMRKLMDLTENTYEGSDRALMKHLNAINSILRANQDDPDNWHVAIRLVKTIMAENNIVPGDLE